MSFEFRLHLKQCGTVSQLTPPGTPQHNGVFEHRNRTLLEMVRSMMSLTDLLLSFWGYALETAAFTLNRAPSKSVEMTPYEVWFGKKPKLSFLKVWSCDAYVKKLHSDGLLESHDYESLGTCEPCLMGKMTKTLFSRTMERATELLEIIHTDVCGPMNIEARGGYHYFLTFIDDSSRC